MKIQLLIALNDRDYAEHLSGEISGHYADSFEVALCSDTERLSSVLLSRRFDVALFDTAFIKLADLSRVRLPLVLFSDYDSYDDDYNDVKAIKKYQRISKLTSSIMGEFAEITPEMRGIESGKARIAAFWSPSGGSGKTTAAVSYAIRKASEGKKTLYLDLEAFSSVDMLFEDKGESISSIFGKLESNLPLLIQSIRQEDKEFGIYYFGKPGNYDDLDVLESDGIEKLVRACSEVCDILVVDLSSSYNEKIRYILESADEVFAVVDGSKASENKWQQFVFQHDLYEKIRGKLCLVGNKNAKCSSTQAERVAVLPKIQSNDPRAICKTISVNCTL